MDLEKEEWEFIFGQPKVRDRSVIKMLLTQQKKKPWQLFCILFGFALSDVIHADVVSQTKFQKNIPDQLSEIKVSNLNSLSVFYEQPCTLDRIHFGYIDIQGFQKKKFAFFS